MSVGCRRLEREMRIDPEIVPHVASQVVLQLVLDGDVKIAPTDLASVERDVAMGMRQALRQKDFLDRCRRESRAAAERGHDLAVRRYARLLQASPGTGRGMVSVAHAIITRLRWNSVVEKRRRDDGVLLRKIRLVIARVSKAKKNPSTSSGGAGFPPPGAGPAGGCPAETRVSEIPPRPRPPGEDPDRHERRRRRN
jgi:hypothetical protein